MSDNLDIDITTSTDESPSHESVLETNASELMDDLFAQLDQQFTENSPAATENTSALSTKVRTSQSLRRLTESTELEVSYAPMEAAIESRQEPDPDWQLSLDETIGIGNPQDSKFSQRLFICVTLTAVGAGLVWVGSQINPHPAAAPVVAAVPTTTIKANQSDVQFAEKMTKSLQKIGEQKIAKPLPPTTVASAALAPKAAPKTAAPKTTKGLPKISLAQAAAPKLPKKLPTNVSTARIPAKREPLPKPLPVKPTPQKAQSTPPQPSTAPLTNELPKVQAEVQPNDDPAIPTTVAVAKPAPLTAVSKTSQTLVGVMELGDQSVALVANNGATRRVRVGEILNESGWILKAVENGQAIIQRRGQVRALDPEQRF